MEEETTKEDRLDRLVRAFSPEETEDDTVDITIDDRLGTCIVKGRYGAGLGFNYKTCYHGLTIFCHSTKGSRGIGKSTVNGRGVKRGDNKNYRRRGKK